MCDDGACMHCGASYMYDCAKAFSISETIFTGGAAINRAMMVYEQRVNYLIATVLLAANMVSCITEQLYRC